MTETKEQPTWSEIRELINELALNRREWAGLPMPIHGLKLTVESKHPNSGLNDLMVSEEDVEDYVTGYKIINRWRGKDGMDIVIYESEGKRDWCRLPTRTYVNRWKYQFNTLGVGASAAWTLEAEERALEKLRELVSEHAYKCYFTSGQFLETSKRSGLVYCFRKLRPTVAFRTNNGIVTPFVALCLHPIGYYQESHAGVMVPTDCVLAHLLLCRGDEHRYWKMSNQHSIDSAEAGI